MTEAEANFADVPPLDTDFPSENPAELDWVVLAPKYCEWCGRTVLRSQGRKDAICPTCNAQVASQRITLSLAAAVRLGIAYLEFDPDTRTGRPKTLYLPGDLLRMTCLAGNIAFSQDDARRRWPFLAQQIGLPCSCANLTPSSAQVAIQHLYDEHIQNLEDWTPTQLVEWIEERADPTPASYPSEQPQATEQSTANNIPEFADAKEDSLALQSAQQSSER
jgi:hypothetical protein